MFTNDRERIMAMSFYILLLLAIHRDVQDQIRLLCRKIT